MKDIAGLSVAEIRSINEVVGKVLAERQRQLQKLRAGWIQVNLFDPEIPEGHKLIFLTEELGEVAKAIRADYFDNRIDHSENIEEELVQLATHVITWRAGLIT